MGINLHLLRIFFTVAELRSFSRAAGALFVSQPAVSKAVRELEHQLDLPLIERGVPGSRGVHLTESGQALYEHARGIFALERAALEEVRARVGLRHGRLLVGASTTIAGYWLPSFLASFVQRYPQADLHLQVGNTQAIGLALIECDIDLALVEGPVDDPRIEASRWRDEELAILCSAGSPLARKRRPDASELNEQIWLIREPGSGTREVNEQLMRTYGLQPVRTIELGSNEGIARAVAAGAGLAMLPLRVVRELLMVGELKQVRYPPSQSLGRPLYLLQLRERPQSPLVRAFCEVLRDVG